MARDEVGWTEGIASGKRPYTHAAFPGSTPSGMPPPPSRTSRYGRCTFPTRRLVLATPISHLVLLMNILPICCLESLLHSS